MWRAVDQPSEEVGYLGYPIATGTGAIRSAHDDVHGTGETHVDYPMLDLVYEQSGARARKPPRQYGTGARAPVAVGTSPAPGVRSEHELHTFTDRRQRPYAVKHSLTNAIGRP